ncbi:putative receptor protein kinase ZmPK1 [Lycium ferocissimum]|uniref:putative receptor protein kinase ZmPK1 n=1 Tax=Lycium ferocissimum TaxID=112874 RepID=UPI0028157869|nr:putative receptor protein kinase ZmPK1 [Lycium ferocissimum]
MYKPVFYLVVHFSLFLVAPTTSSSIITSLSKGSSLSTSQDTVISSPNHDYAAGFHPVGENAYSFAIWFGNLVGDDKNHTIVWMANRDKPVNGRHSRLSLTKSGNLVLTDASQHTVWKTETQSDASVELELLDTGNLVLTASDDKSIIWQSFDTPTDTLLPGQALTKNSKLVSLRSLTNYSSGFYKLHFSDDNVLQLLYEGLEMSGVYWPPTWLSRDKANRSTYNNSRIAVLDRLGQFNSTDNFNFRTTDYGGGIQRRLTLDIDGNLRVYSLNKQRTSWEVSWQLNWQPCTIHGLCGLNSLCTYSHDSGRKCTCLQRHKMKNVTDWSYGCEPDFKLSCPDSNMVDFVHLRHVEFYGYDSMHYRNVTLEQCKQNCLHACDCKGFQFKFETEGIYVCLLKTLLSNGYRSPSWQNSVYIKLPKDVRSSEEEGPIGKLQCERTHEVLLERTYKRKGQYGWLKSFIGFTVALGMFEVICLISYLITTLKHSNATFDHQVYIPVVNRFKRFTYAELKKATSNFRDEIGQGSGGVVYKGKLPDNRIAAIKCLKLEASQGEAEFLAEVSTIGKLNHMNLIDICGYCAEGKHRLLVYEYMEHGSLADNLHANNILDWQKRFEIALGTAKGLAYLHEECLEWVLHCDIKPQNILLDSNYEPKVADFGLSRLLNRSGVDNSCFSTIRGTRGYMAPEWIFHHPITSKVDVYSYGILLLELITRKSPNRAQSNNMDNDEMQDTTLVTWVREKMHGVEQTATQIQQVVDPSLDGVNYLEKMEVLIKVALQCSEEDRDARPTMSQVVDMLQA